MKKTQLKKLIRKTIKESQLGAFQPRETPHDLDPQDLEYYLDQIQGMPTDEAIVHLGKLGITSGQAKKVISQLDTGVSDMFRGHSDYEDPFPSTKKGIGDLNKFDLYETKSKKMKKTQLKKIIKEEIKSLLKEMNIHDMPGRGPHYLSGVSGRQPEDVNPKQVESNRSMRAYQIANDMIRNQMDFPEDSIEDEKLFLATISALNDKLYEKAADMFSSAGSAPDEGEF